MWRFGTNSCASSYIARNGVQISSGLHFCNNPLSGSESVSIGGWKTGDKIELWGFNQGSASFVENFRVYGGIFKAE